MDDYNSRTKLRERAITKRGERTVQARYAHRVPRAESMWGCNVRRVRLYGVALVLAFGSTWEGGVTNA